ncbi:hypothetical protein ACS0TY_017722 [Phlomoides rotata]
MLATAFPVFGIGLNSTTYHIDALPEVWAAHIKIEIFGNERASGHDSQHFVGIVQVVLNQTTKHLSNSTGVDTDGEFTLVNENSAANFTTFTHGDSSSVTNDKGKGLKRK